MSKEKLVERHGEIVCCPQNVECTLICDDCDHMGEMMYKLAEYEDLEEQGLLLRLPVAVGSKVYEIIEETVPEHYYYISECEVEDVSTKTVMYAGDWIDFNYPNLYFDRAEAEEKLRELEEK